MVNSITSTKQDRYSSQTSTRKSAGVPRILIYYSKECFVFSDNFIRMTFPFEIETGSPIEQLKDISDRQKQILIFIYNDTTISKSKLSEIIKINESAIQKHFKTLQEKGYLKRIGGTRGYWEVNLKVN